MAGEQNAQIETYVPTVLVNHPRLGKVRMNLSDYKADLHGPILEEPTEPAPASGRGGPAQQGPALRRAGPTHRRFAFADAPGIRDEWTILWKGL
jgi:hypothetical protein